MAERIALLESRIESLEKELQSLRESIAGLQAQPTVSPEKKVLKAKQATLSEDAPEKLLSWVGKSSLLPCISTLCFLLVFALILRTLTDNDVLDKQIGAYAGMSYAALLIAVGWFKYRGSSPLAPIFGLCGAVLMFTIVVETNAHFASLPSAPAYVILVLTALVMAGISYFYGSPLPVLVGTLGMGIAAVSIDFPHPYFPHLAMVLLVANLLGAFATRVKRCSWLRWIVLLLTVAAFQVWGMRIVMWLAREGGADGLAAMGLNWYLPMLALFTFFYLAIAVRAVSRPGVEKVFRFDLALPTVNVLWAFGAAAYVIRIWWETFTPLAIAGVVGAAVHFGVAYWLTLRRAERTSWANAFIVAGTVLLVKSLPILAGGFLPALPFLSLLAFGYAHVSRSWGNTGLRLFSYLLQVVVVAVLSIVLLTGNPAESSVLSAFVAASVSLCALFQFRWVRDAEVLGTSRSRDRAAILVLAASLMSGFLLLRTVLYQILLQTTESVAPAFQGGQTVIINCAAAGLLFLAFRRRNKELRNIAVLATVLGGGRVFLLDFLNISGVPLVAGVFTFGLAVLMVSVVLGKWQSLEALPERSGDGADGESVAAVPAERRSEEEAGGERVPKGAGVESC